MGQISIVNVFLSIFYIFRPPYMLVRRCFFIFFFFFKLDPSSHSVRSLTTIVRDRLLIPIIVLMCASLIILLYKLCQIYIQFSIYDNNLWNDCKSFPKIYSKTPESEIPGFANSSGCVNGAISIFFITVGHPLRPIKRAKFSFYFFVNRI